MEINKLDEIDELKEIDIFFDEDWIKEAMDEEKSYSRFYKTPIKKIGCYSFFVDISKNVIKFNRQYLKTDQNSIISQTQIINIIKNDTKQNFKNFRIEHLLNFNLNIDPTLINNFISDYNAEEIKKQFLKEISYTSDTKFSDTINYLHPLNCLIFIYKEKSLSSKNKINNKNKSKKIFTFKKQQNNKTKKQL